MFDWLSEETLIILLASGNYRIIDPVPGQSTRKFDLKFSGQKI